MGYLQGQPDVITGFKKGTLSMADIEQLEVFTRSAKPTSGGA